MILYPNQKELTAGKWLGLSTWFRFLVLNILADLQELDDDWLFILCKCKCSDLFWSFFFFWNAQCQVWSLECTWEKNLYHFKVHQLSCVMSPGYYFGGMNTWGTDTSVFLPAAELQLWPALKDINNERDGVLDICTTSQGVQKIWWMCKQ